MDLGIAGRKAIVCASSKGLGRACAEHLAAAGCAVVVNGRDGRALDDAAEAIRRATGAEVTAVPGDVTDPAVRAALVAACPDADILVNNAAGPPPGDFRTLSREDMLRGVDANMITPIALIQALVDGMCERGFGRIVTITSASVRMPIPGLDLSSGARAGLTAFLAGAARQVAGANVTINQLLPGSFDTDRLAALNTARAHAAGIDADQMAARTAKAVPAGRFGRPDEFGAACAFLCSAHAGYITGQNLLMDGGAFPGAF